MKKISLFLVIPIYFTSAAAFAVTKEFGAKISLDPTFGETVSAAQLRHGVYNKSGIEFLPQFKNFYESSPDLKVFSLTGLYHILAPMSGKSLLFDLVGSGLSMISENDFTRRIDFSAPEWKVRRRANNCNRQLTVKYYPSKEDNLPCIGLC